MSSFKGTPQTEKSQKQDTPYRSIPRHKDSKQKCPNCEQHSSLLCYACCYQLTCQNCYTSEHFLTCNRQFNKHTISLTNIPSTQQRSKGNRKVGRNMQKCRRCDEETQYLEYCKECNSKLCNQCSKLLHAKGKFQQHHRVGSQSPSKLKRINTLQNQNCQVQLPKKQQKNPFQSQEYGFKAKDKVIKPSVSDRASKHMTSSTLGKKGRSIAKNGLENQENTPFRRRKNSTADSDLNLSLKNIQESVSNQYSWLVCSRHNRKRNVLTESFDLVCQECYENLKNVVGKIRNVELDSWLSSQSQKQNVCGSVDSIVRFVALKSSELSAQFSRLKNQLENEFQAKKQLLNERYMNNLLSIEKWQTSYNKSMSEISDKCSKLLRSKVLMSSYQLDPKKELDKLTKLQNLLLYEQILKTKKDFNGQLEQYQFRLNTINSMDFEDLLKNYAILRKKVINDDKNMQRMSQTTQMRQSRISNSSMVTDRKITRRNDSMVKSNYYELSGKNLQRSRSKDITEELYTDISQKILFPVSNGSGVKSDKKNVPEKMSNFRNKNSYFFDNPSQNKNQQKQKEVLSIKDVKYINLETVINDKIDRNNQANGSKKEALQLSTPPTLEEIKNTMYLGELTEDKTERRESVSQLKIIENTPMIQSLTMNQPLSNLNSLDSRATITTSVNSSMNAKNKRKSDYMEMRDRLRKPSMMTKIVK